MNKELLKLVEEQLDWGRETLKEIRDIQTRLKIEKEKLPNMHRDMVTYEAIKTLIQQVAQETQEECVQEINLLVTKCLETVFGESLEFKIEIEKKRGKTEARIRFYKDGHAMDPLRSRGGGVVDIVSFALRVASIVLLPASSSRYNWVMVLDEPAKFLSKEYRQGFADMLEMLERDLGFQFIVVTHFEELEMGRVISLD